MSSMRVGAEGLLGLKFLGMSVKGTSVSPSASAGTAQSGIVAAIPAAPSAWNNSLRLILIPMLLSSNAAKSPLIISPSFHRQEPLHALAREDFAGVDVALGIDRYHVQPEKLAAVFAHVAHLADYFAVLAVQKPNVVVGEVGNIKELLRLVWREHDTAGGPADSCGGGHNELPQKLALLGGHLNAIGVAVRGIDEPIVGNVQGEVAAELLRHRPAGSVGAVRIVRGDFGKSVAIGAPTSLEL